MIWVTSYELRVNILTSCVYCTSYELQVIIIPRVASYFLHTSYELLLLHELQVIAYCTSYKLLCIAQVTSYFLHTSYDVLFTAQVTSYFLTMSYNKDKNDKAVYDNKIMIKNCYLRYFFDKELEFR